MKKTTKLFIVCAAVCAAGIIMAMIGFAMGGVEDIDKVAERYDWVSAGPGETHAQTWDVDKFESIEAEGNMEIIVIGAAAGPEADGAQWDFDDLNINADWDEETMIRQYLEEGKDINLSYTVLVSYGENAGQPEVSVEDDVLRIKTDADQSGVDLNFTGEDAEPKVVVFCGAEKLKNIDIDCEYSDIALTGIRCEKLYTKTENGDISFDNIVSEEMKLETEAGKIAIHQCEGDITATTDYGDVEFASDQEQGQFEISATSESGYLFINGNEQEMSDEGDVGVQFSSDGGPGKLSIETDTGDIKLDFGE